MSERIAGSSPLVVVDPVRLAAAAQECTQVVDVQADWPDEDRRRVDYLYAAGLRQLTERTPWSRASCPYRRRAPRPSCSP